jgi:hypothetical protein
MFSVHGVWYDPLASLPASPIICTWYVLFWSCARFCYGRSISCCGIFGQFWLLYGVHQQFMCWFLVNMCMHIWSYFVLCWWCLLFFIYFCCLHLFLVFGDSFSALFGINVLCYSFVIVTFTFLVCCLVLPMVALW